MEFANSFFKENKVTLKKFKELKDDYETQINKSLDKKYTHYAIQNEFNDEYRKTQNEYSPCNWVMINKIEELIKRNKASDLYEAIGILTKKINKNELVKINEKVSTFVGYFYFSEYLIKQNEKFKEIQLEVNETNFDKLEWLGSQKELGELFLALNKKGWLKEINSALIKKYFTKSNTIDQILKPSLSNSNYEGVYTKKYKPKFDLIRPRGIKSTNKK
jgi:hypothetical protein